jgi:hypothetical protein
MSKKSYTISVTLTDQAKVDPLEAAKDMANLLKEEAHTLIYDVVDEETGEKFTVDLSEEDEDAVLPNND